jgi:putative cell wall-binding protein
MPVLLVREGASTISPASVLASTQTTHVVLVGGEAALGAPLKEWIEDVYGVATTRLSGADRYATATEVAEWALAAQRADAGFVGVATGSDWPDALAGAALAGSRSGVLLLARPTHLGDNTGAFLEWYARPESELRVFGGQAVVSPMIENQLRCALPEQ